MDGSGICGVLLAKFLSRRHAFAGLLSNSWSSWGKICTDCRSKGRWSIDRARSDQEIDASYDVEEVSHDDDHDLDEDQNDDGPLKTGRMLMVELVA